MFNLNRITCDYPLPVSEIDKEMENPPDWSEVEFHIEGQGILSDYILSKFSIESDGQIYEDRVDFTMGDNVNDIKQIALGIEKKEYTGELIFHGIHFEEKYDFLTSFKSLFWKGDLKEIELVEWEKVSNSERVEAQKQATKMLVGKVQERKKWWFKPLWYVGFVIRFFLVIFARILGFFLWIISKIENYLP